MDILTALLEHPVKYAHLVGFDRLGPIHDGWLRKIVLGSGDWTLQAFRGSYKTTTVSVALAILAMLRPNLRIAFMRKTDTDVKEVMAQVQMMLLRPESRAISDAIWGRPVDIARASQTEITTNLTSDPRGSAQLLGIGTGGSLTGKHFDIIFTDDIVNPKDRVSRAERERTKSVYMELQNIKNRGGRIINTGTPWHIDDAFSIMPDAEKWDYTTMPELFGPGDVDALKSRMTPSLWAANYELRHIPSDDIIFTDPLTDAPDWLVMDASCHVDAAYGGEDFTAFTAARWDGGRLYVLGRLWRKHVDDVADAIMGEYERLRLGKLYMETNGDKGYGVKAMRAKGARAVGYSESMNKVLKIETHLKGVWPLVVFCKGTDQAYIDQVCDWTEDAEHDDAPDSLACMARRLKKPEPVGSRDGIIADFR